jgi:hypothetical protein
MLDLLVTNYLSHYNTDLKDFKRARGIKAAAHKRELLKLLFDHGKCDLIQVCLRLGYTESKINDLQNYPVSAFLVNELHDKCTLKLIYYRSKVSQIEPLFYKSFSSDEFEILRRDLNHYRGQLELFEYKLKNLDSGKPINGSAEGIQEGQKIALS